MPLAKLHFPVLILDSAPLAGPPVHVCRGCCSSEGENLEKAVKLVQAVFLRTLTAPALNKWTTVAPCINLVFSDATFLQRCS